MAEVRLARIADDVAGLTEVVLRSADRGAELPVWSARKEALWLVDNHHPALLRSTMLLQAVSKSATEWEPTGNVGTIGRRKRGGMVMTLRTGFALRDGGARGVAAQRQHIRAQARGTGLPEQEFEG